MTDSDTATPAQAGATAEITAGATELDFEAAMAELEALVARMEGGELSLDDSLQAFERGVHLTRACQQALANAELRVKTLTDEGTLAPFDPDAVDDA